MFFTKLKKWNLVLPVAFAASFALAKLFFFLKYHLPIWDEAVYLGMGKYIYSAGNAGLWEILRPVGLPVSIGWAWKLGMPYILFSEIISLLFGMGVVVLFFFISRQIFDKKIAVLATVLLATSPAFFLYSSYILTEVPSTFFAMAALLFFLNKRYFLCGAAASLAALFKFPQGLALVAIVVTILAYYLVKNFPLLKSGKIASLVRGFFQREQLLPLVKVSVSFSAVMMPFLIFNYAFYRSYTSNAFDAIFRPFILGAWHQSNPAKAIAEPLYNYSFYAVEAFKQHLVFVFALAAFLFVFWKRRWFASQGKLLLAVFLAVYAAYFSYIPNKDERFLIMFLPAICVFTAAAFFSVISYFKDARNLNISRHLRSFVLVASVMLLVLSLAVALYKDISFYNWRPSSEPVVASELYRSISNIGIKGPVLTSEPVFAAYNNNRFFPYYFTSYEGVPHELKALNEWEQNVSFEGIIFSPQTLLCPENNLECRAARSNMPDFLNSNYKQVFNSTHYDGRISYYIYVNESLYNASRT